MGSWTDPGVGLSQANVMKGQGARNVQISGCSWNGRLHWRARTGVGVNSTCCSFVDSSSRILRITWVGATLISRHHCKSFLIVPLPPVLNVGYEGGGWHVKCHLLVLSRLGSGEADTVDASYGGQGNSAPGGKPTGAAWLNLEFAKEEFSYHFLTWPCSLLASICYFSLFLMLSELFYEEICGHLNFPSPGKGCMYPTC